MKKLLFCLMTISTINSYAQCTNELHSTAPGGARILTTQGNTPSNPAIGFHSTPGTCGSPQEDGGGGLGIFRPLANVLGFSTASQERMRINSSGNVGIGTSAPAAKLHIDNSSGGINEIRIQSSGGSPRLSFFGDNSTNFSATANYALMYKIPASSTGNYSPGFANSKLFLFGNAQGSTLFNSADNIGFGFFDQTANTTKTNMIIEGNSGRVGIGTTAPTSRMHVVSTLGFVGPSLTCERNDATNQTNSLDVIITSNGLPSMTLGAGTINFTSKNLTTGATPDMAFSANNVDQQLVIKNNGDVGIATNPTSGLYKLDVNGMIRSTSLLVTSDAKFKSNIKAIENAQEIINKLEGVTYYWKKDQYAERKFTSQKQIGFIAQDVEKVLPEAVSKDANGDYAVNYIEIIPVLTEAFKSQSSKIESLESEIQELKNILIGKNDKLLLLGDIIPAASNIKLYPNPTESNLQIDITSIRMANATIQILDMSGKLIKEQTNSLKEGSNQLVIDMQSLQSGLYFIKIQQDHATPQTFKVTKQ